jgi:PKD repeat protein
MAYARTRKIYRTFSDMMIVLLLVFPEIPIMANTGGNKVAIGQFSISSWWNSAWMYRRSIIIDNTRSQENLREYQVLVTLDTASLISAGRMRPDCGDIRFIDSDGTTQLSYWIEPNTCNIHNTMIWIKIPSIPASTTKTIYMYYGNPTATTTSDAGAVFTESGTFFHTRYSTADPDSLSEALNAYSQAQDRAGYCYMLIPDYTYVSNDYDSPHWSRYYCPSGSGSSTDVAFWVEAVFYVDTPGVWEFRLGPDYGRGGGLYVDNVALDERWTSDLWWDDNWNSPSVLKGSIKLDAGWHKLFTIGFEDCCEGGHTLQFKKPGGDWAPWSTSNLNIKSRKYIIPEPITSIGMEENAVTPSTLTPAPPSLTISNRVSVSWNGLTVTINGEAAPGYSGASISRIHWDWGDGSSEDHWFPATHTYSNYGTYIITVTVYQSDGLTSTKIVQLVLSRSVASSALSSFLGQIKIKASIIKNQTDGSYSFTLQIIPDGDTWLLLDDAEIQALKNNIFRQLVQKGLLSSKDKSRVDSLVVIAPSDIIDEKAVELFDKLLALPLEIQEVQENVEDFGVVYGLVLSSATVLQEKIVNVENPPEIVSSLLNYYDFTAPSSVIGDILLKKNPVYKYTDKGWIRIYPAFVTEPGTALIIVVKGLQQPLQNLFTLQINGEDAVWSKKIAEAVAPSSVSTSSEICGSSGTFCYYVYPSAFSTSITLKTSGWWDYLFSLGKPLRVLAYSEEIVVYQYLSTNGVPPTVEVNVYSPEDIIKNAVLEPSAQSIKQDDPLDVSVSFDLDPSFISSLQNLGPESASVQEKPVVTVELYEEREIFSVHFDNKIAEKSLELQSTGSTLNKREVFNLHGSDLGWFIWHGGNHKLYARITLKYCESKATWITQARWGTIVVETPRVTVSVGS